MNRNITTLLFHLSLWTYSAHVSSWEILTDKLDISCEQTKATLNCSYRTLIPIIITGISANSNTDHLQVNKLSQPSEAKKTTAILFLVDTSDPNRQDVIEKNKFHIKKLLTKISPDHSVGIASFDKSIKILAPVGSSKSLLSKSVDSLNAQGKTTELYRNLIKAIEHLKSFTEHRKLIVLMSDGQAEDKAYFHTDVIKEARKNGVVINSIGYPRTVSLSVSLQTMRRLSEETGGVFFETNMRYELPSKILKPFINNLAHARQFMIELSPLFQKNLVPKSITVVFDSQSDVENINIPVEIRTMPSSARKQTAIPVLEIQTSNRVITNNNPLKQALIKKIGIKSNHLWLWYGLPVAFIIIIIFIFITLFLLWYRRTEAKSNSDDNYKAYAYLITDDGTDTRYPITRKVWRIGRSKDNELNLNDNSLSRRHAEIHRKSDGTFHIIDTNSMNGIYINHEKIERKELHEGDVIEIGDILLRFTQMTSDYSLEEATIMERTKAPINV